jgi:hypothetical protein
MEGVFGGVPDEDELGVGKKLLKGAGCPFVEAEGEFLADDDLAVFEFGDDVLAVFGDGAEVAFFQFGVAEVVDVVAEGGGEGGPPVVEGLLVGFGKSQTEGIGERVHGEPSEEGRNWFKCKRLRARGAVKCGLKW